MLSYCAKKGLIEKLALGIYRGKESVLAIYDLTERVPRFHWIAVSNASRAPRRKTVRIVRMRNFKLGQSKMKFGKESMSIFNRTQTVIDAFRFLRRETTLKLKGKNKVNLRKMQL